MRILHLLITIIVNYILRYIAGVDMPKIVGNILLLFLLTGSSTTLFAQQSPIDSAWKPMFRDTGIASYYAQKFEGRLTANGERYHGKYFTAAHRTLPFGTLLKVTNPKNGKWVVVRVNDRGPHYRKRKIDLSYRAAKHLGLTGKQGLAKVYMEEIPPTPKSTKE